MERNGKKEGKKEGKKWKERRKEIERIKERKKGKKGTKKKERNYLIFRPRAENPIRPARPGGKSTERVLPENKCPLVST